MPAESLSPFPGQQVSPLLLTGPLRTPMLSAPGPQNPHDLEITYASLLVLLSSRLTGPYAQGPLMGGGERLFLSTTCLFKERAY